MNMSRYIFLLIGIVLIATVVGGILLTQARVLAAPEQPVAYSHQVHLNQGIQCLYCHTEAARSEIAGIPSVEKCMGCHSYIVTDKNAVKTVADYWERGEPIPWKRVNVQPKFVYFSHQSHTLSGLNCETCHGDVGSMDAAVPVVKMDMGWCLNCHQQQSEEKVARLVDCLACHK